MAPDDTGLSYGTEIRNCYFWKQEAKPLVGHLKGEPVASKKPKKVGSP
jgi:hypothetical protein